ncbi:MAG: 5-oxoprolinase, partial [Gammaproteobacteria bacterium]|nr:5-oxoprolinase [Gammaproteobacteria bacterium]
MSQKRWQFWVDRGGTFTDVVARHPEGTLISRKLLSDNPTHYSDAAVEAIRELLLEHGSADTATTAIDVVKMGTTVATNALLERNGDATVLLITRGFADALRIAYQNRPDIFAQKISLPALLYCDVIEVQERITA